MGEKVKLIGKDRVEFRGKTWKVRYNETNATLKLKEVKGGVGMTERVDVSEDPYDIEKKYLNKGYKVLEAHNWKKLVEECHNSKTGVNKKRTELTVQADGLHGDGVVYSDEDIPDESEAEEENTSTSAPVMDKIAKKMGIGTKALIGMTAVVGIGALLLLLKALKVI